MGEPQAPKAPLKLKRDSLMVDELKELMRYRDLLLTIVIKELKVRYKGSLVGFLWTLLTPLFTMAIYTLVFSFVLRIQVENFSIFFLCGLLPWQFFSLSVSFSLSAIVGNGGLIKKVYFPREVLPLSTVLTNLVGLLLALPVLFVFLLAFKISIGVGIVFLPLVIFVHFLFTVGITLLVSSLYVYYRDLNHILEILLNAWFFLTPVIYPLSMVPEGFRYLFLLNPMTPIIILYRQVLFEAGVPEVGFLCLALVYALLSFFLGLAVFRRFEVGFAEEV